MDNTDNILRGYKFWVPFSIDIALCIASLILCWPEAGFFLYCSIEMLEIRYALVPNKRVCNPLKASYHRKGKQKNILFFV